MLEIRNLNASYGKKQVLTNINLKFERGKFYSVIGRNGSGKSTLLSCICSLIKYSGSIKLDGNEVSRLSDRERAGKISLLQQQTAPSASFTALELCSFGRNAYGEDERTALQKASLSLEKTGISHLCDKKLGCLSGGERQLCYFAMNLCQDAEVLLLDEPASNLDAVHEATMLCTAKELCNNGKTVICVIHNLSSAVKYADEIIVIDGGQCVFASSRGKCLESNIIQNVFGVKRYDCDGQVFFGI